MLFIIILIVVAFLAYHVGINRILGLPPGPPPLPLIGNMLSFKWDLDSVLLKWKERYGSIFTVWLPFPMVVIGDHRVIQEQIVQKGDVFLAKKNPEQLMEMMAGGLHGLVFEDNSIVKEQRRFAMKSLHEIGFGSAALEDTVYTYAMETVDRWKKSGGKAVDVTENIMKTVGNVVWSVIFGSTLEFDNEMVPEFRQIQQDGIPLLAGPLMMFVEIMPFLRKLDFLFGFQFKKLQVILDKSNAIVRDGIKKAENSFNPDNQPTSYVEAFLREMKKNEESGKPAGNFHYAQMQAAAFTLWGAGFDTTVAQLRLCCLELVNHPEVQTKLQKEIDDVIGERRIRYEDQKQLPFTCAFLQEVYRIGSVLPMSFLRKTTQNTEIEGYNFATGTTVLPQFSMVHADPKEFERPDYFCPERHIDSDGKFVKDLRIAAFGSGRRACLGETLARMEIFVLFATFVQHCNFAPIGKVPPPVTFTFGFTRAVDHFMVKIAPRN